MTTPYSNAARAVMGNFGGKKPQPFASQSVRPPEMGQRPHGYAKYQQANYTPEQMELYKSLFSQAGPDSYLSRLAGGDESLYEEMEAPALRQFAGIQGQTASRFSGMGEGARRSSGFQNESNQAASDFASQLQSQRQGLQRQAIMDLGNFSNMLLKQRPYDSALVKKQQKQPGFWENFGSSFANSAGKSLGSNLDMSNWFDLGGP